jgi:ribonuclease Z
MKQFGCDALLPSGKHVVCLGDEPYNARNARYARGADWLLCEAFCLYKDRAAFRPYEKHHSTALDAGRLAQELGVHNLLLYHTEDTHLSTRKQDYTAEAASVYSGKVWVPCDLEVIDL